MSKYVKSNHDRVQTKVIGEEPSHNHPWPMDIYEMNLIARQTTALISLSFTQAKQTVITDVEKLSLTVKFT